MENHQGLEAQVLAIREPGLLKFYLTLSINCFSLPKNFPIPVEVLVVDVLEVLVVDVLEVVVGAVLVVVVDVVVVVVGDEVVPVEAVVVVEGVDSAIFAGS